jgi:undecaprenyl-diphosphatase
MPRKTRLIFGIIGILLMILLIYSVVNYGILHKTINDEVNFYIQKYGLIAVFILVFLLEISPQPFVSGLVPLASGMAVGIPDHSILVIAVTSVVVASFSAYTFGYIYGEYVTSRLISKEKYDEYVDLVKKHGNFALAVIAFTPIPYFPSLVGAFKMDLKDFFIFGIFFRILHFLVFGYILTVLI